MCRLLYIESQQEFEISDHLDIFSIICEKSKEYQGHGWGCSFLINGEWKHYKNLLPIWEDDLTQFGSTRKLVVHARSAFRDKDIYIENNMPFYDENFVFIFNGELHGVKIKSEGRIGAEKIFNFIKKFNTGDILQALNKGVEIIKKRSNYIKAMNMIIADKSNAFISSYYNEDPEIFGMW